MGFNKREAHGARGKTSKLSIFSLPSVMIRGGMTI
jgi:hypothetical protein